MLKRLEILGFKSFARKICLDFPGKVCAIVGPNGSGKSNIADAIRWVLGEQSLKTLRTKESEDLIFGGSAGIARLGKASVDLIFDNTSRRFPLELDEITISRRSYRDGLNQYLINNSQVRLKDIIEMLAKVGIGSKGYSIIAQGAADALLTASDKERRDLLEEALGLKEFRLKKTESLRKLAETDLNLKQAKSLIDEIFPRLKTLSRLASRVKEREEKAARLKELEAKYFASSLKNLKIKKQKIQEKKNPVLVQIKEIKEELIRLRDLQGAEEDLAPSSLNDLNRLNSMSQKLDEMENKLTRELGRIEGMIEAEKSSGNLEYQAVTLSYAKNRLEELRILLEKGKVTEAIGFLNGLIQEFVSGKVFFQEKNIYQTENKSDHKNLKGDEEKIKIQIAEINAEKEKIKEEAVKLNFSISGWQERLKVIKKQLEEKEKLFIDKEEELRGVLLEEDKLGLEENQIFNLAEEAGIEKNILLNTESEEAIDFFQIQKLKREVESIMSVDPEVVKEFEAVSLRHQFLTSQVSDLEKASSSLRELIRVLDQKIDKDFRDGLAKISEEFNRYFRMIFGGGKAGLNLVSQMKEKTIGVDDEEDKSFETENEEKEKDEYQGCEIRVEIPGKKIKGLSALSGGERSLTALGVLFGIVAVNPPPFLVLDEIDAALDESNSRRFAGIFRDLSQKSQFVIITHNRETMSQADVLYGVTLAEDGASKLLSIKFDKE